MKLHKNVRTFARTFFMLHLFYDIAHIKFHAHQIDCNMDRQIFAAVVQ